MRAKPQAVTTRQLAVEVALEGLETLAGATREVVVNGEPLTAEQVRDLAAVLSALADDLP